MAPDTTPSAYRSLPRRRSRLARALVVAASTFSGLGWAQEKATPGYAEQVTQWTVQRGETCEKIAEGLYGSEKHVGLLQRYNDVACRKGEALPEGSTLVVPVAVVDLPAARVNSLYPDVRARAAGGSWAQATQGMPLFKNHTVNTLAKAQADILFMDRTRVVLGEHTLVVIYGASAASTSTNTLQAQVELESGEVQAGLAALRGQPARVSVSSGGRVSANSRDTVVHATPTDTIVSVFDGDANVESAGATVNVPTAFGTKFQPKKPPAKPRPLPPAPEWGIPTSEGVVVETDSTPAIVATWSAIPNARAYRIELALDPEFHRIVVREEAPASVNAFRGEQLPAGTYHMRVRVIDNEEYLGLASPTKSISLSSAHFGLSTGKLNDNELEVSPYDYLEFDFPSDVEMAFGTGPFGPPMKRIDLQRTPIEQFQMRSRSNPTPQTYRLKYRSFTAELSTLPSSGSRTLVEVRLSPAPAATEVSRIAPRLRVLVGQNWNEVALSPDTATPGLWRVELPSETVLNHARLTVVDASGKVLGSKLAPPVAPIPPPPPRKEFTYTPGACGTGTTPAAAADVAWWAPTACDVAAAGAVLGSSRDSPIQGQVFASGQLGSVAVDMRIGSADLNSKFIMDNAAWLGVRWRAFAAAGRWSFGPALRLGLPTTQTSPTIRVEGGVALAWQTTNWAWISNLGGRVRPTSPASPAPKEQAFLLSGFTFTATDWLLLSTVMDAHVCRTTATETPVGVAFTAETTTPLFVALGGHVNVLDPQIGGRFEARANIGMRGW